MTSRGVFPNAAMAVTCALPNPAPIATRSIDMPTDDVESKLKLHALSLVPANDDAPDERHEEMRRLTERVMAEAAGDLDRLVMMVSRAWDTPDRVLRRSLVVGLVGRVQDLRFIFDRWSDTPHLLRLVRLIAREHDAFDDDELHDLAWILERCRLPCEPEVGDLVLEMANAHRGGFEVLLYSSDFFPHPEEVTRVAPEVGARLAEMVRARGADEQLSALEWLRCGRWPKVAPALREILTSRSFPHRTLALQRMCDLGALEPEDVVPTLEDVFEHGAPEFGRDETDYVAMLEEALRTAITSVRPTRAAKTLAGMARNEGATAYMGRFGTEWALRLLVLVDPECALPEIDRRMSTDETGMRASQVENVQRLPEALVGPWLARLLDDPSLKVAAKARNAWRARYPDLPPPGRGAGPAEALLSEPPSEWFHAQLVRAEADPDERPDIMRALWEAPPSTEALVLLVRLASDESLIERLAPRREDAPPARLAVIDRLVERFGEDALHAVALAASQVPIGPDGWMDALLARHAREPLPDAVRRELGDTLVRLLKAAPWATSRWAVKGIEALGESAGAWRTLVKLADDPDFYKAWSAVDALERLPPHAEYDGWLEREACRALDSGDLERAETLVTRAVSRLPGFVAPLVVERCGRPERPNDKWLDDACSLLVKSGHLSLQPFLRALETPESWLFETAMSVFTASRDVTPLVEERLRALLGNDARRGRAAAKAAAVLVHEELLPADDPLVFELAARAPANDAAWLLMPGTVREDEPGVFAFAVARALLSATDEDELAQSLAGILSLKEGWRTFFLRLEPRLSDNEVRAKVRAGLGIADDTYNEVDPFWLESENAGDP